MKLLSSPQGKSQHQIQGAAQELRLLELDALIVDKRRELTQLDQQVIARPGILLLEAEEQIWKEKVRVLHEEVENLERRKKMALVPLEEREKQIDTKEAALSRREQIVAIKESGVEEAAELLEDKLDSVSEREQNALSFSADLQARSSNLALEEEGIVKRKDALVAVMQEFHMERLKFESEIATQKAVLKGRDTVLAERERIVAKKEQGFEAREKSIVDRYKTLQRAIAEMKMRHGDNLNFKDTDAGTRDDNP